ncbi:MAG: AsmA family protein, partial [Candidatus Aerophobus sp.]
EKEILVKEVTLNVAPKGKPKEKLVIKGEILREKGKRSKFELLANRITVDNFLPFIPTSATEKKSKIPKEEKVSGPAKELSPLDLTDIELEGIVDIKALTYKKLSITDLRLNTSVADNIIDVKDIKMKINNADFITRAKVKVDVPGWQYSLATNLKQLNMAPVVDSFAPQIKDKMEGITNLTMEIKGQGTLPHNLQQHLKGKITGERMDGKIGAIPILTALAEVTQIPELEELRFFKGIYDLNIDQGKININKLDFQGKIERLVVRGWVGLDEKIDLSLQVALAPPLNRKLKELRYIGELLTDAEGYTELPVPVGMTGTFSRPKPSLKLKSVMKEKGKELLEDLLRRELLKEKKRRD